MTNITMTIDEKILKKARKVAVDKNTTLTAMIRNHLGEIAGEEEFRIEEVIKELKECFNKSKVAIGNFKWKREDLYER